jgi:hypothetical protein
MIYNKIMFGVILIIVGTILDEISSSAGKWNVNNKKESIYTLGFLNFFWVSIIFLVIILIKGQFLFNLDSLPLFALLMILEIAQAYSSLHAVVEAERSTFGFLMVGTIPLLLLVDIFLGYPIVFLSLIGISLIVVGLLFLFTNHGLSKKGMKYVLFSTFNAVATISIFKYLITNYNSVEAQQFVTSIILLIFLFIMAIWRSKENPLTFIFKKRFLYQSISRGFGVVLMSTAYLYAPASVITGAKRGTSVLASIVSGNKYFHEKHLIIKIISFMLVVVGLILLVY